MASLDTRRPAAMEQLAVLGQQVDVPTLPIVEGQTPVQIANRAIQAAKLGGYDVVLLDTAGRITLDEEMMARPPRSGAPPIRTKCCWSPTRSPARTRSIWRARSTSASA